ncbi:MAG TPA: hypothetical protein VES68_00580 [Candidatus Sulfotelmatobacter sp.]|nr:hypothetical protein [Candidatus Sulfotelmatobacter sp.]
MSSEINLVTGKTFSLEKRLKQTKILRIIAIVCLVLVSLASIVLFLITVTLPISSVKKDEEQTISSLSLLHKKHASYALVSDRITNIKAISSSKKDYARTINEILKNVPETLSVDSMIVDSGKIEISFNGSSLLDMDKLINNLIAFNNSKKYIKNLLIESLVLNSRSSKVTLLLQADIL